MATKTKLFRGVEQTDIQPGFRRDIQTLSALSAEQLAEIVRVLVDEAKLSGIANLTSQARKIVTRIGLPYEEARPLASVGRMLASRLAETGDAASDVADDLVQLQVLPVDRRGVIAGFLAGLQGASDVFRARRKQYESLSGGGYHLAGWSVFPEFRVVLSEPDVRKIALENFSPEVLGFAPSLTLELDLHGGEENKTISIRLGESDIVELEHALRAGRIELEAAKKKLEGAQP